MSTHTSDPVAPYAHTSQHHDATEDWVRRDWQEPSQLQKADFIEEIWSEGDAPVNEALDLCCGTGLTLVAMTQRGYRVTGLDRSPAMLEQAARKLEPEDRERLVLATLPDIPLRKEFDAAYSTGGALNYLPNDTSLLRTFEAVHRVLRPGGTFVFDLYTDALLARQVEQTTPATRAIELGEGCTFLFTCRRSATSGFYDMTMVRYVRDDATGTYARSSEEHRLFTPDQGMVRGLVAQAGFGGIKVFDNYTRQPTGSQTLHETYTMVKPG
ncbi:class I SAM-dependent methyltransferase [Streptomyces marincola]|uniref:class I SAM-dependent methyltransferase n=1 Tax=Streptomyces marincola TaxID=2878388 RepID=UPI001CF4E322|nr:class I SAM-dependent methyltransferase [Streptomyces marincola]UCM86578.1 class I SAM-dependent methyltransferase [Streptomyces marincola]